jgi:hypothetical protein
MFGHFDDEFDFRGVGRLLGFHHGSDELVEHFLAFAGQDGELAAESVGGAVLRDFGFGLG